jgi:hypothetical protein
MKTIVLMLIATALTTPTLARAQYVRQESGYTIITPGAPPTFVNPSYNGYTAITPSQPPTFINRNFNGGYTVITPGEPPTFINPAVPSAPSAPVFGENDGGDE